MTDNSKEGRLQLALDASKEGLFTSKGAAAKAFDVPPRTLMTRLNGTSSRKESVVNGHKLLDTKESTLTSWILDMDRRGLPTQISTVRYLAQLLLSARIPSPQYVGKHWVSRFVERHPELSSKYTRKYDYQQAKCEDPVLIGNGFKDSMPLSKSMGSALKISITWMKPAFKWALYQLLKWSTDQRQGKAELRQYSLETENGVTAIIAVSAAGWALSPQIILAAENHQSQWYTNIPKDYRICLSENGWTNDIPGSDSGGHPTPRATDSHGISLRRGRGCPGFARRMQSPTQSNYKGTARHRHSGRTRDCGRL
jgi:hypothetical protein